MSRSEQTSRTIAAREQLERDRAALSALAPTTGPITGDELAGILRYAECGDCGGGTGPVDLREDGPDPHVIVARIERSPWPEMAGETCHGVHPEAAEWVIWTNADTGDGFRLACTPHLGEWVEAVSTRLWDPPQ